MSFLHLCLLIFFHWRSGNRMSFQISSIPLSILGDLQNVLVWMVSIRPPISYSFSHFTNLLETVPSAPITVGITVTHMFHSFCSFQARFKYLSHFSFSLIFLLCSGGIAGSLFLLIITRSAILAQCR